MLLEISAIIPTKSCNGLNWGLNRGYFIQSYRIKFLYKPSGSTHTQVVVVISLVDKTLIATICVTMCTLTLFHSSGDSMLDKIIIEIDKIVKTLTLEQYSHRPHPDHAIEENPLSDAKKKHACGLMRVNHSGEICAQALYQGQALTARDKSNAEIFQEAAFEETEHLAWTAKRVNELGGKTSLLNPLLYIGSLAIGVTAGLFGDKWNLSFLEETEKQVEKHLEEHLNLLPVEDEKSRAIVTQMKVDEAKHAKMAHDLGAAVMPLPLKLIMKTTSKMMTKSTYYI